MTLDRTFVKELKAANGDGSREAKFAFLKKARAARKALSTPDVMRTFGDSLREHGRAAVGACVASTILTRENRLHSDTVAWAREVMNIYANRPTVSGDGFLCIDDQLHPTRIEEYAGSFIRCTTEEGGVDG